MRQRQVAIGDPQAPPERFFAMLRHHGLLGEDGSLRPEVGLISVGDHFDYRFTRPDETVEQASRDGITILRWLASHPPDQVTLLLGNHDAARVCELINQTDASYAAARALAGEILSNHREPRLLRRLTDRFHREHPDIPTPGVAARDYNTHTVEQRDLVVGLLLADRFRLAATAALPGGQPVLLTHAGITRRQLGALGGIDERDPEAVAAALNGFLEERIRGVRARWELRGQDGLLPPLDLSPVYVAGATRTEGGGLLYHRPSDPDRRGADRAWEFDERAPRRFHPRELPSGLHQVCGHTGHSKCLREMPYWATEDALAMVPGRLRTLTVGAAGIRYDAGILRPEPNVAALYMIDGGLAETEAERYEILELG